VLPPVLRTLGIVDQEGKEIALCDGDFVELCVPTTPRRVPTAPLEEREAFGYVTKQPD
jgi:hypothetical protein